MKRLAIAMLLLSVAAFAKDVKGAKHYSSGTLLQMDSVACGSQEKQPKVLCQEYLLQTDKIVYRIRPRDNKQSALLPVGEKAQFRIANDKMLLRVEELDNKEREYSVVSTNPRAGKATVQPTAYHINHLQ